MIFTLTRELFRKDDEGSQELQSILRHAFVERHVVLVETGNDYDTWLARRTEPERAWIEQAVDGSLRRAPYAEKVVVRVVAGHRSNWASTTPELVLADAAVIANAPLRILLEDFEDDAHFVRWIGRAVDDAHWHRIDGAMKLGWAEVVHGGGNGSMLRLLHALDEGNATLPWGMLDTHGHLKVALRSERTWVMFDHDGVTPGAEQRGATARKLAEACKARRVHHHGLERRSIENYLPLVLLKRWASGEYDSPDKSMNDVTRARRAALVQAFEALDPGQRRHYYLREGLSKDAGRDGTLQPPWDKLPVETQFALACGFDAFDRDGITRLFGDARAQVKATALHEDGSLGEARAILRSIVEAL